MKMNLYFTMNRKNRKKYIPHDVIFNEELVQWIHPRRKTSQPGINEGDNFDVSLIRRRCNKNGFTKLSPKAEENCECKSVLKSSLPYQETIYGHETKVKNKIDEKFHVIKNASTHEESIRKQVKLINTDGSDSPRSEIEFDVTYSENVGKSAEENNDLANTSNERAQEIETIQLSHRLYENMERVKTAMRFFVAKISLLELAVSRRIVAITDVLKEDFAELTDNDAGSIADDDWPSVNFLQIRCSIIRLSNIFELFMVLSISIKNIIRWKNPQVSLLVFIIYMYSVYNGWLLSLVIVVLILFLVYSNFRSRYLEDSKNDPVCSTRSGIPLNLRNQIVVSTFVLKRAQFYSSWACDNAEKIKNVILWKQPEITTYLFLVLCFVALLTFVIPASELFTAAALYAGFHAFIIEYAFYRFPRLRKKYDKLSHVYEQLMSDDALEKKRRIQTINAKKKTAKVAPIMASTQQSTKRNEFTLQQIPFPEIPLPEWREGRRATLLMKSNPLSGSLNTGILYLTNNLLIFRSSKTLRESAIFVPLRTITSIEKMNIYVCIPGGGKGIKIETTTTNKVLIFMFQVELFGKILNRDEAYKSIVEAGRQKNQSWALRPDASMKT